MYLSDYMKHHRGSRNLADDIANVINNLKRKRILGLGTLDICAGSKELVRMSYNFCSTGSLLEMHLFNYSNQITRISRLK